jgi:hypothetical protein
MDEFIIFAISKDGEYDGPCIKILNNQSKEVSLAYCKSSIDEFYSIDYKINGTIWSAKSSEGTHGLAVM